MKKILFYLLLFIVLIIFYIIYINYTNKFALKTEMSAITKQEIVLYETPTTPITSITWKMHNCKYTIPENIKLVFDENNIKENNNTSKSNINMQIQIQIHLPCTYDKTEQEINNMDLKKNIENKVYILHNADQIAAKNLLWINLIAKYGLEESLTLSPMTYILYEINDIKRLKHDYKQNKLYILKKNIQRQEGLKICNELDDILKHKNEYIIAQELLQDPYLINGRKINLRIYVLVVCNKDNYNVYIYNDGFMYYTKELFEVNSLEFGPNITTGYIDRSVYKKNPLTHQDFRKYLDTNNRKLTSTSTSTLIEEKINKNTKLSDYIFNNVHELIKKVFSAFYGNLGYGEKLYNHLSFQLFGADVAIDKNLNAKIMEVNKGVDLNSKDKRDGALKKGLITDILKTINAVENDDNNKFINIYSV